MPRINAARLVTTGYGTTWFDATRAIRYNVPDGNLNIELSDGTHLYGPASVASVYAGAGHWCAEINGVGVVVDGTRVLYGAALGGYCDPVGLDGSVVVKRVRDSFGPWGFVDGPDFGGDCKTVTNDGGGRASWIEGDWAFHTNFGSPFDGTRAYNYRLKGADFLFQSADTGELVLNGRVIGPSGNYYRPDLDWNGTDYLVVWSPVEGEPSYVSRTLTLSQLAACPVWQRPPVVPAPLPPPSPMPVPEVPRVSLPNHLDVVQRERAKYPTMIDDATCFAVTNAVANDPAVKADGWGLTSPPAGNGVTVNGRLYRIDKLSNPADGGHICDVLGSSGTGGATAQWDDGLDANGASQWAPAVTAMPTPAPTPTPTPRPSVDLTALTAQVSALELMVQHLADQIEQIQGTSVPVSALAAYAKHGDAVSVTGHVAVYGLKSSDATWTGKIL